MGRSAKARMGATAIAAAGAVRGRVTTRVRVILSFRLPTFQTVTDIR